MEAFYWSAFGNIRYTLYSSQPAHSPLQLSLAAPTLDTRSGTVVPEWIQRMKMREVTFNSLCSPHINFSLSLSSPSTVTLIHSARVSPDSNTGKLRFNMIEIGEGFLSPVAPSCSPETAAASRTREQLWESPPDLRPPRTPSQRLAVQEGPSSDRNEFSNLLRKQTGSTPARDKRC